MFKIYTMYTHIHIFLQVELPKITQIAHTLFIQQQQTK